MEEQRKTDEKFMRLALNEAQKALKQQEVPIGAVVVAGGAVIGRGHNLVETLADPTAHAEILALRAGGAALGNYRLNGCVLAVTLEPCAMCAAALAHARLAGVVYGATDDLAGAVISRAEYLDAPFCNHRVWHMGGVRAEACAALLRDFFERKRG